MAGLRQAIGLLKTQKKDTSIQEAQLRFATKISRDLRHLAPPKDPKREFDLRDFVKRKVCYVLRALLILNLILNDLYTY